MSSREKSFNPTEEELGIRKVRVLGFRVSDLGIRVNPNEEELGIYAKLPGGNRHVLSDIFVGVGRPSRIFLIDVFRHFAEKQIIFLSKSSPQF